MGEGLWLLIAACGVATYLTRAAGYLIISRFGALHYRVEAALDAVPAAVLTALLAPSFVNRGPAEALALLVAGLVALRLSMTMTVAAGLVAVVALRALLN